MIASPNDRASSSTVGRWVPVNKLGLTRSSTSDDLAVPAPMVRCVGGPQRLDPGGPAFMAVGAPTKTACSGGKKALLSPPPVARALLNGDLDALRPIHRGIFEFTGFSALAPEVHWQPVRLDDTTRTAELASWANRLRAIDLEEPIVVGRH